MNRDTIQETNTEAFDYKGINQEQIDCIENVRLVLKRALAVIDSNCTGSKEKSVAITKLEEVSMWANKAISHHPEAYINDSDTGRF